MGKISLGYSAVPSSAKALVLAVLKSGQFSPGPKVLEFERRFAALHGAKHAVFVNSGTDALRLGLLALKEKYGWEDGDEVAVPTITFVATVNVILQAGLVPFFIDVGMNDYCLNPWNLERRTQDSKHPRLRAIMPVHMFGRPCDPYVFAVARRLGLKVLEDSCETILNRIQGDVSCHSTYMAHHVTTGVGGFALTNDADLNLLIRSYANHGRSTAYLPGYRSIPLSKTLLQQRFRFDRNGYSCRGTEFEAALGIAQLPDLRRSVLNRRMAAERIYEALAEFRAVIAINWPDTNNTCMMFPVVLMEDSRIDKYDLCLHLERSGIETRDMMPITNQPCFKKWVDDGPTQFSVADWINRKGFYIPCHPGMTMRDIRKIKEVFRCFLSGRP